jgi:hypothetical protein
VPALHVPVPLQVPDGVSTPLLQDAAPQLVPAGGNAHVPVVVQSVAPHVPPIGLHVIAQQCVPVLDVPQTPLAHWSFAPHGAPEPPFATHVPVGPGFAQ